MHACGVCCDSQRLAYARSAACVPSPSLSDRPLDSRPRLSAVTITTLEPSAPHPTNPPPPPPPPRQKKIARKKHTATHKREKKKKTAKKKRGGGGPGATPTQRPLAFKPAVRLLRSDPCFRRPAHRRWGPAPHTCVENDAVARAPLHESRNSAWTKSRRPLHARVLLASSAIKGLTSSHSATRSTVAEPRKVGIETDEARARRLLRRPGDTCSAAPVWGPASRRQIPRSS